MKVLYYHSNRRFYYLKNIHICPVNGVHSTNQVHHGTTHEEINEAIERFKQAGGSIKKIKRGNVLEVSDVPLKQPWIRGNDKNTQEQLISEGSKRLID